MNPLREERDRYLAFAFTHADLLMEIDTQGLIAYADGALSHIFGDHSPKLDRKPFEELFY